MTIPKHIVIACSYLHVPGGYEKAVTTTVNLFAGKGHKVTLLILDHTNETYYPVNSKVSVVQIPVTFGISEKGNAISRKLDMWRDIKKLKNILLQIKPDHLISTEYHFTAAAILAGAGNICPVYSWEHHHFYWLRKNKFWAALSRYAYRKVNKVVCLNRKEEEIFRTFSDTVVIPNFIELKEFPGTFTDTKIVLSVAGLIPRKGIDMLLDIAAEVLQKCPEWKWKLLGSGELQETVLEFIKTQKLEGRFILQAPEGPDIEREYRAASLYVMTSRFEAFPMVLLESMSFGVPCVSFDCPSGPSEIISHNETGLIIQNGNTLAMSTAIIELINDPGKRRKMSATSLEKVKQFHPDKVYEQWQLLFDQNDRSEFPGG